jgi:hypothetical protein
VQESSAETREVAPICLTANNLSIATGQPSLVLMSNGSMQIPVWSLSGGTVGQSVSGLVGGLPSDCVAVKVEIVVTTTDAAILITCPSTPARLRTRRSWFPC